MLRNDAAIDNEHSAKAFATVYFTPECLRLPMNHSSQPLLTFPMTEGVMQPNKTAKVGYNTAANVLEFAEPYFENFCEHLLAWHDDFALNDASESARLP